jgi:hypothetical protein
MPAPRDIIDDADGDGVSAADSNGDTAKKDDDGDDGDAGDMGAVRNGDGDDHCE